MDGLTVAIRRCNLKLKLDNQTIVQQCRRPEVKEWLKQNKPEALFNGPQWVRRKVTHFALNSNHGSVNDLKAKYEKEIQQVENKSWIEYWKHMAQDGIWVDHIFVQMVAWYMELDILILTTSSTPEAPFIFISGKLECIKMGHQLSLEITQMCIISPYLWIKGDMIK